LSKKIGIPRSLLYYYYYPAWEEFFHNLGYKVVLSPPTNKSILDDGVRRSVDDLCLPFKVYFGHVKWLIDRVDYLFIPRLISFGKGDKFCPKFMGLPDMIRSVFSDSELPNILEPVIENKNRFLPFHDSAQEVGKKLNANYMQIEGAYWKALLKQREFISIENKKYSSEEAINLLKSNEKVKEDKEITENRITVVLLGHSYLINDKFMSMGLFEHLSEMNVDYITPEMLKMGQIEEAAHGQNKPSFWYFNRHIMGAAYHYLNNRENRKMVDGLIQVTAFGCGPDSLISQLIDIRGKVEKDISILNINIDEHGGQAGLKTRLEAFVDLLERRNSA
jgi:predicted nucleotide-binding protein (sugar kinase/HSP70/actin superfamily)